MNVLFVLILELLIIICAGLFLRKLVRLFRSKK